jgi:hypothetical protein
MDNHLKLYDKYPKPEAGESRVPVVFPICSGAWKYCGEVKTVHVEGSAALQPACICGERNSEIILEQQPKKGVRSWKSVPPRGI